MTAATRTEFIRGVREALPVHVLYQVFGIPFGVLAAQLQLPLWAALGMSWFGFAGSAQFMVLQLLGLDASLVAIFGATALINLRHLFYSMALSIRTPVLSPLAMVYLAHSSTDETFGVNMARTADHAGRISAASMWGTNVCCHGAWMLATVIGVLIGDALPQLQVFAALLPIFFAVLLALRLHAWRDVGVAALSGIITIGALQWVPGRSAFLYGALLAPLCACAVSRRPRAI